MAGLINSDILRNPKTPFARATAARTTGAVAGTSQALTNTPASPASPNSGSYYDEGGYHPGTPSSASGGYYDESGSYHPGASEGSSDEAGWHPPKEAPTLGSPGLGSPALGSTGPAFDLDTWANTPWNYPEAASADEHRRINFETGTMSPTVGVASGGPSIATDYVPPVPAEGALEKPGIHETTVDQLLPRLLASGDPKVQAIVDQLLNFKDMPDPNLDPWYDREWKRAKGGINSEFGGRGLYNSGDALRALSQSRESLAADQAKEEADYAMESMKNKVGRLQVAAGLQGSISDNDLERMGLALTGTRSGQEAEEGRWQGQIDNVSRAFSQAFAGISKAYDSLLDADKELVNEWIMAGPGPSTNKVNLEARMNEQQKAAVADFAKLYFGGPAAAATPAATPAATT